MAWDPGGSFVFLERRGERFVFTWDDELISLPVLFEAIAALARDEASSFTWADAAEVDCQVRRIARRRLRERGERTDE